MIVYFTGTGNSRHCARLLAGLLEDQCVDAFHWIREGIGAELQSEKPWVFVSPTYAWQLPRVFRDFIRSGRFGGIFCPDLRRGDRQCRPGPQKAVPGKRV